MKYDPFQEQAINYINEGYSVIVSAPTGAGKTVIAEHVINSCLQNGTRAIYTAPIKALSNQKYRDFQKNYSDKIGLITGDVTMNSEAPILIMTTEIFRNKILADDKDLAKYSWIIFDEIHYIDDYERGTVWEESLIFLPDHMKLLALSATIPNIDELAGWLEDTHKRKIVVVKEDKRPVPLHFFYQCQGKFYDHINSIRQIFYDRRLFRFNRGRAVPRHEHLKPNKLVPLIGELGEHCKLPCIYFVFSRKRTEYLAEELLAFNFLSEEEKREIRELYSNLCLKFGILNEKSAVNMAAFIEKGIAFHHAGMLPTLKEVIERLFTSKLIKVIFTTETFSLGINMPARTVVFDELRKFYGQFHRPMRTREFYQMAGRAGRRGLDKEGFVYIRVNPHMIDYNELKNIIYGDVEKVLSRFNASYATILNLYNHFSEKLYDIYPLSFHYYQEKRKRKEKALMQLRNKVAVLKELGYIRDNALTPKGKFASKIYGYELPLTELYDNGHLNNLSATELAITCLALVYEPRKGMMLNQGLKHIKKISAAANQTLARIQSMEKRAGISPLSKNLFYEMTPALDLWMAGEEFDKILRHTEADEGEVIRYFRMCVQVLREIADTEADPAFIAKVKNAISLINRGIVDAEKQLRIEID